MTLRKPTLPPGWHPRSPGEIAGFLAPFPENGMEAPVALAPHAGWYYSGAVAAQALASLRPGAGTVVVLGGHLPGGFPPLYAEEDAVETPQGIMEFDGEFRAELLRELPGKGDRFRDNTVEVLLPMVRHFFPLARLLWLRLPNDASAFALGRVIARTGAALGRNFVVLGSTDLTHYGENYGFSPQGPGPQALDWVKTVNDRRFIDAVLAGKPEEVLERALTELSACSPGAALGCLGCAAVLGTGPAALLDYATSAGPGMAAGEGPPGSFVGYAGIAWEP